MIRAIRPLIALMALLLPCQSAQAEDKLPPSFIARDGVRMAHIPKGEFLMGTDHEILAEFSPKHAVYVSGFYIDEHAVTNKQFTAFLSAMFNADEGSLRPDMVVLRTDLLNSERQQWWPTEIGYEYGKYTAYEGFKNYPVITVSWDAAEKYCKWAGKRLPTEAEWEKAARGGLEQKDYVWGNEAPIKGIVYNKTWLSNASPPPTGPVKSYLPNGYGVYDMSGMVWEWCSDWFHPEYYKKSPLNDPRGPDTGEEKVQRGGAWSNPAGSLYVAVRNFLPPMALDETTGFRCAMDEGAVMSELSKKGR